MVVFVDRTDTTGTVRKGDPRGIDLAEADTALVGNFRLGVLLGVDL